LSSAAVGEALGLRLADNGVQSSFTDAATNAVRLISIE